MKEHKQMFYFEIDKTCPTKEDGDWIGNVLVFDESQGWFAVHWSKVSQLKGYTGYTHWMQMPKAPSTDDRDA